MIANRRPFGIIASMLLLSAVLLSACNKSTPLPDNLKGHWGSGNKRYVNCYIIIDDAYIIFGWNRNPTATGVITKVAMGKSVPRQHIIIEYSTPDLALFTVELVHVDEAFGRFWFVNQPDVVWERYAAVD